MQATLQEETARSRQEAQRQHIDKSKQGYGSVLKSVMHDPKLSKGAKAFYAELASTMGRTSYGFPCKSKLLEKCHISEASYYKYRNELMRSGALFVRGRFGKDGGRKSSLFIIATHDADGCPVMPDPTSALFDEICGTKEAGDISVLGAVRFVEPRGGNSKSSPKGSTGGLKGAAEVVEEAERALAEAAKDDVLTDAETGTQTPSEDPVSHGSPHPKNKGGAHPKIQRDPHPKNQEGGCPQYPRSDTAKPSPKTMYTDNNFNNNHPSDTGLGSSSRQGDRHSNVQDGRSDGQSDSRERKFEDRLAQTGSSAEKAQIAFSQMAAVSVNRNLLRNDAACGECADRIRDLIDSGIDPRAIVAAWDARQNQAKGLEKRYYPQLKRWLLDESECGARDMAKAHEEASRRKTEAERRKRFNEAVQRDPKLKALVKAYEDARESTRLGIGDEASVQEALAEARAYARSIGF